MTTTLVFGNSSTIFQPQAFLVSFVSCSFGYWKPSSDTATYGILFEANGEAKAWVNSDTSYSGRLELEVNFSALMVQGAGQAAQLPAPGSLLSRHKPENIRFLLQHIFKLQTCTNLHNKYFLTKHSNGNVDSSQDAETQCPCHLCPTGTL